MEKQTYNGWTNYETWVTKLWMDNDRDIYGYLQEEKEQYVGQVHAFAEFIRDYHDDRKPELGDVFSDLLNHALSSVNWYEIAESILND